MANEHFKLWLNFAKFIIGTVILGVVSLWINHDIQMKELELREMGHLGEYIEYALQENVGTRRRFAQYFSTVVQSEKLRQRCL